MSTKSCPLPAPGSMCMWRSLRSSQAAFLRRSNVNVLESRKLVDNDEVRLSAGCALVNAFTPCQLLLMWRQDCVGR